MNSETKLVFEIWDHFRDIIPASKRHDACLILLKLFDESGFDYDKHDLEGECEYMDEALLATSEESDGLDDWEEDEDEH